MTYLIDDVLTHYVHNPHCARLGNYFWKRIPKKLFRQLECPDGKPFKVAGVFTSSKTSANST